MTRTATIVRVLALFVSAGVAGCGEKGDAPANTTVARGIAAMTDEDKVFYASSFTTIGTVPYGRSWPESLLKILSDGREIEPSRRLVMFNAPKRFKQNEGYSEWMRVKSVVVEHNTRRVVAAKGRVGPFPNETAVQAYLDSEVRSDLNSQIVVVRDDSSNADGEMRFVCTSRYGDNYTLRIVLREDSSRAFWLDILASVMLENGRADSGTEAGRKWYNSH